VAITSTTTDAVKLAHANHSTHAISPHQKWGDTLPTVRACEIAFGVGRPWGSGQPMVKTRATGRPATTAVRARTEPKPLRMMRRRDGFMVRGP
jgi:hypothetical protein